MILAAGIPADEREIDPAIYLFSEVLSGTPFLFIYLYANSNVLMSNFNLLIEMYIVVLIDISEHCTMVHQGM